MDDFTAVSIAEGFCGGEDVDGMNRMRAAWAAQAVKAFLNECGTDDGDAIPDLICDLLHLANQKRRRYGTPDAAMRRAQGNFDAETGNAPY